jgi:hypothetical protein
MSTCPAMALKNGRPPLRFLTIRLTAIGQAAPPAICPPLLLLLLRCAPYRPTRRRPRRHSGHIRTRHDEFSDRRNGSCAGGRGLRNVAAGTTRGGRGSWIRGIRCRVHIKSWIHYYDRHHGSRSPFRSRCASKIQFASMTSASTCSDCAPHFISQPSSRPRSTFCTCRRRHVQRRMACRTPDDTLTPAFPTTPKCRPQQHSSRSSLLE